MRDREGKEGGGGREIEIMDGGQAAVTPNRKEINVSPKRHDNICSESSSVMAYCV